MIELLIDKGADVNAVAGNGLTALDVADAAKAPGIIALLERNGGRRAREL
jgi:ankyrin repeat protein